jgi:NAD(P)-dependent dehydrogenase (short-subunit alcohol dehydrogenase family)
MLYSLGFNYRALVIGSTGALGTAFAQALRNDPQCAYLAELSRRTTPGFTLEDEASIAAAANTLKDQGPFALIIDATGALTIDGVGPEKHLGALDASKLLRSFQVNTIGPALLLKHFLPLLRNERAIFAKLSARVGSISDNQKGGWYGYRASKAALNMMLQTAGIEFARKNKQAVIVALQPGTVASPLSQPFASASHTISAAESASGLLKSIDALEPRSGAHFVDYAGQPIAW